MLNVGSNDTGPLTKSKTLLFCISCYLWANAFDYYSYFPHFYYHHCFLYLPICFLLLLPLVIFFLSLLCLLLSYGGGFFPCQQRKILYCLFFMSIFFCYLLWANILCMIASLIYLRFRKFLNFGTDRFCNFFVPLCLQLSCICSLY